MTLEGPAQGPDDTPAPPARTRWSEESAEDDAGLMPPYIPGARTGPSEAAGTASEAPSASQPDEPFPFEQPEDAGLAAGPATDAAPAPVAEEKDESFPFEDPSVEDDFPFDAFDLSGGEGEEGEGEAVPTIDPVAAPETPAAALGPRATELADRLEGLAEALRREGAPALDREMGSADRFRALVAGVVAGYLAGLEE